MKYKLLKEKTQIFLGLLFFFNQHCISGDFRRNYFEISNADSVSNIYDTSADWIQFKKHYAFKNIYLVYAGPYPASPSSSFGHLFLLLEPIRFQENQILLWDVAEFSADVDEIKPIEKFYKGILGGLVGSFKIIPFYEKLRQYTFIESRPLWIFPIKTSPTESKTILYNLFQQFGKGIKYRFHDNNCASQIELLLKNSFNENQNISGIITSPRTVLINLAERLNKPFYIESTENLIKNSQIAKNIESKFGKLDDFDTNIKGAEAAVLLNVLEWKYFHRGTLLKKNEKIQIEKLRLLVSNSKNTDSINLRSYDKNFVIHPPIKFGLGLQLKRETIEYLFQFRLGLHELSDNADVFPKYDFISLGKMNFGLRNKKLILNELWLFDQQSTTPKTMLSSHLSWRFAFGARKVFELEKEPVATGIHLGLGTTFSVIENKSILALFFNFNPVYLEHFHNTILFGPEAMSIIHLSNMFKMKITFGTTHNLFEKIKADTFIKSNLFIEVSKDYQFDINSSYTQKTYSFNISLLRYIN